MKKRENLALMPISIALILSSFQFSKGSSVEKFHIIVKIVQEITHS